MVNRSEEIENSINNIENIFSKCFDKPKSSVPSILQLHFDYWYLSDLREITLEGAIINSALFNNKKD